jgi:hypothetical protein
MINKNNNNTFIIYMQISENSNYIIIVVARYKIV